MTFKSDEEIYGAPIVETCYVCIPLATGITVIGIVTIAIFAVKLLAIIIGFLNIYFTILHSALSIVFLLPMIGSVLFFIMYWVEDTKENRGHLSVGMVMVLLSVVIMTIWTVTYIAKIYDYEYVYLGFGTPFNKREK